MDLSVLIFISMGMFSIGLLGVLLKRNVLMFFLSIELLLNAANLLFVSFSYHYGNEIGLAWVFFVLVVAAAEAAVGMALIINLFRSKQVIDVDQYDVLKG
jgi:NADH-quinone oxidoreductase subunit K